MTFDRVIAVDLGGTNVRAAIVRANGTITLRANAATPKSGADSNIADAVAKIVNGLKKADKSIGCVGLAVAAVVDAKRNHISRSPNLPQLNDYDLAEAVLSRTGLEAVLENDATAAAIGEHWLGAGMGVEHMLCVTLGTGVGGGLVLNGTPYYGVDGNAGEVGHICLDKDGPVCGCGSNGCLEQYASATAIVRITKELLSNDPASSLHSRLKFTSEDVHRAAIGGDRTAISAFQIAGKNLGTALAGLVNVLNPETIVITGGVAAAWELFIESTEQELSKRAFQQPAERVKIVRGTLGDDAGVLGAAKRAFSGKGFS